VKTSYIEKLMHPPAFPCALIAGCKDAQVWLAGVGRAKREEPRQYAWPIAFLALWSWLDAVVLVGLSCIHLHLAQWLSLALSIVYRGIWERTSIRAAVFVCA